MTQILLTKVSKNELLDITYTVYLNLKFGFHTLSISDCGMPTYSAVEKDDRLNQF